MKMLLALAAALLPFSAASPTAGEDAERAACPPVTAEQLEAQKREFLSKRKVVRRVSALVGVDSLGRVLMALDYDRDEIVEELVLFTPRERLEGPWSELVRSAEVENTSGTLRLEAHDGSVAIALAVYPADLPTFRRKAAAFKRVIQENRGNELVRNSLDPAFGRHLSSFDHTLIETWPESFRDDLVVPGTTLSTCYNCISAKCKIGGCSSAGCSLECPGIVVNGVCGITCNTMQSFACCNCTNGLVFPIGSCRCIACKRYPGPIP
jgi:hypothetical protein